MPASVLPTTDSARARAIAFAHPLPPIAVAVVTSTEEVFAIAFALIVPCRPTEENA
jgi:hypothetical protein